MITKCRLIAQKRRLIAQKRRLIVAISRGKRKGLTILIYIRECFHSLYSFKHSLQGITLGFLEPRLSPLTEDFQLGNGIFHASCVLWRFPRGSIDLCIPPS